MQTIRVLALACLGMTVTGADVADPSGHTKAFVCSYYESPDSTRPPKFTEAWVRWVVLRADAIVRVRAIGPDSATASTTAISLGGAPIEAQLLDILAGRGIPATLTVFGTLYDFDVYPREPVPYIHAGYSTACYRSDFRRGGEHLLLLWRAADSTWTAFGPVFAPSMIQVTGLDDPWVRWVRAVRAGRIP